MKQRALVLAVLCAAFLLVAALVGVLTLGSSSPLEDQGPHAELIARRDGAAADGSLPEPLGSDRSEPVAPPEPLRAPAVAASGPNTIIGRVVDDETGAPVASFTIEAVPHSDRPPIERLDEVPGKPQPVRAVAGIFRLERSRGRWDVVVQSAGYKPGALIDVEVPRPDARPIELRLSHGPSITGLVYDDNNLGVPDVPVFLHVTRLSGAAKPPRATLARTDAAGRFRFSPLPAGLYSVSALEPDSADVVHDIALDGGTAEVAVYVAPRQQVVAAVRDPWGRPVRDAQVELRGPGMVVTESTNAAGQAQLRFIKPGSYDLHVSRDGYVDLTEPLELLSASGEVVRWFTLQPEP